MKVLILVLLFMSFVVFADETVEVKGNCYGFEPVLNALHALSAGLQCMIDEKGRENNQKLEELKRQGWNTDIHCYGTGEAPLSAFSIDSYGCPGDSITVEEFRKWIYSSEVSTSSIEVVTGTLEIINRKEDLYNCNNNWLTVQDFTTEVKENKWQSAGFNTLEEVLAFLDANSQKCVVGTQVIWQHFTNMSGNWIVIYKYMQGY